jgi:tetratricopeptide (TPR) repeat protein
LLDCSSRLLAALRDAPGLSAEEHASAWIDLADLCSEHLGDRETALCALEVAVGLLPKNLENRERLANLYQEDGRFHDAIAQHQSILDLEPSLLPSYNALARLLEQTGNASAAAACQQAVSTMCSETPKHIPIPKQRTAVLDNETMALLRHAEERFALGHLLALLTPAIATTAPRPRRRPTFGGRKSLSANHPASVRAKALAEQLGVHPPAIYMDAEAQFGVQTGTERSGDQIVPAIIFNKDAAASADSLQTSFLLARSLVLLRREYLARAVQPSAKALGHALDAVFELARSEPGVPVSKTATALAKAIDTTTFDQLKILVRKLRPDKHAGFDIVTRWIETSTMSANRVALWLVGDLLTALEGSADDSLSKRKSEEARQDLIRAFCSPLIRADMQNRPTSPLTKTPHEGDGRTAGAKGKSQSLRKDFRNIARTVTEEIRLDSL